MNGPQDLPSRLRELLRAPLPGHDDFRELGGYVRPDLLRIKQGVPPPRESAVLVLLYPEAGTLYTLLMLRPTYIGVHSAQVGFPGGHREPGDPDLAATALREFTEETGARPAQVEVFGPLTQVYIPPSHNLVTPVLAYAPALGPTAPDPNEVARLIPVPVAHLLRDDILKHSTRYVALLERELEVPYWDVGGEVVWGATALMIAELRRLLLPLRDTDLLQEGGGR